MAVTPHHLLVCVALGGLILAACSRERDPVATAEAAADRQALVTDLASVTQVDGQIVVELGVGSDGGVLPGDLFRVYGTDPAAPLKGMVQVTDVLGDYRSLARQIGLHDRNRPLAVADEARLVRHLSIVEDTQRLEQEIDAEQRRLENEAEARGEAFQGLRSQYSQRLAALERRHLETVAELERAHEAELVERERRHQRELERLRAEQRADLAALRTALTDEAGAALRRQISERDRRIETLEAANEDLRDQVAARILELERLQERIRELHAAREELLAAQRAELAAERETREVLEQRVVELERRVAGRGGVVAPVLTNDAERDETVLERLERVAAERDQALARAAALEQDLGHQRRLLANATRRLEELQARLGDEADAGAARAAIAAQLEQVRGELAALRETAADLQLKRLQAQRAYLDLAARVLRLEVDDPGARDLQDRLRRMHASEDTTDTAAPNTESQP